jgi:hypothetical protein
MHLKWFWVVVSIPIFTITLQGQSREAILSAVSENSDWTPAGEAAEFDETNIDTLVGSRADILRTYGLVGVTKQSWNNPVSGNVTLTLYQMTDPSAAYGWFTFERDPERQDRTSLPVGAEGYRQGNRSTFWQANYVVLLEGTARATESLADLMSGNIVGRSRKAPVSSWLPPDNLVPGTEKYTFAANGLDRTIRIDASKLGFEDSVEVATARYSIDGRAAQLVLLLYPTQQVAKKHADRWDAESPADAAFRKRRGPLLAFVRGTDDPEVAAAILDAVNYESQVTWNEPRPDISLGQVIVTIFTFIGIALVFTLVAGVGFGGFRVFVKKRYPNKLFDRAQDVEIIQLKLPQRVNRKQIGE